MADRMTFNRHAIARNLVLIAAMWVFTPSHASPVGGCGSVAGATQLWTKPSSRFVLIGEMHGTAETPAAFTDIVCAALQDGKSVAVGLELPVSEQPLYDSYLASDGTAADRAKLIGATSWAEGMKDGRTSLAMFAALEKLRTWKRAGVAFDFFAFQPSGAYSGPADNEATMALPLVEAAEKRGRSLVIALMGNMHASKSREIFAGVQIPYDLMAMHLPPDSVITLLAVPLTSGSMWSCELPPGKSPSAENMACGAHPFPKPPLRKGVPERPGVVLFDNRTDGYDGVLLLDHATASPPAVP